MAKITMSFLEDYKNPEFMTIFREYFQELGITIKEETDVFDLMEKDREEKGMKTLLLYEDDVLCSFIMFQENVLDGWFFKKREGFIREVYVAPRFRGKGYGNLLMDETEKHFLEKKIHCVVLTADDAVNFYEKRGYVKDPSYVALNQLDVYAKML